MQLLKNFLSGTFSKEAYTYYLQSEDWKIKREQVLIRDKYRCRVCKVNKQLEAHHLTYEHIFQEFLYELITLCGDCHGRLHEIKSTLRCNLQIALKNLCTEKKAKFKSIVPKRPRFQKLNHKRDLKWLKRKNKL